MQLRLEAGDQLVVRRRRSFEDRDAADVLLRDLEVPRAMWELVAC